MPDSPYAPPRAVVADAEFSIAPIERPRQVSRALVLLWISLGTNLANIAVNFIWPVFQLEEEGLGLMLAIYAIAFPLAGLLYFLLGKGLNWARILTLAYICYSAVTILPIFLYVNSGSLSASAAGVALLNTSLKLVAGYLLLSQPARKWFRNMRGRS